MAKQDAGVEKELSNLYGSSWHYATYYLLLKSESREGEDGTHYFYKGGREAANLYNMLGWDFERADLAQKAWYARERARMVQAKDEAGYRFTGESEQLYETEKKITAKAVRLGRALGMDVFREKIKAFVLAEERTLWFESNREAAAQRDAVEAVYAKKLGTVEKDVMLLSMLDNAHAGEYVNISFGPDLEVEPARFLGVEEGQNGRIFYLEHLREIAAGWTGTGSVFHNLKENAFHDGCLETVSVDGKAAEELYVGLNCRGSFRRGRLEARCVFSDMWRKMKANIQGRKHNILAGRKPVYHEEVAARYKARGERYLFGDSEADKKRAAALYDEVIAKQEAGAAAMRKAGATGLERIDAILAEESRKQRESVIARYRMFARRPERLAAFNARRAEDERPPRRLDVELRPASVLRKDKEL